LPHALQGVGLFQLGWSMERQYLTSVIAALSAWWLIEQVKKYRNENGANVSPVSGIAQSETNSETMV
jgi:hypothetical protein